VSGAGERTMSATPRWSLRRGLRMTHAWTGLAVSMLIAAMALSGSVLLFKDDLRRFTLPRTVGAARLDPAAQGRVMNLTVRRYGRNLRYVRFPEANDEPIEAVTDDGGAYLSADGKVLDQWPGRRPLDWLAEFHHRLLLGKRGGWVVGAIGLVALLLMLSGIWLWWPLRRRFRLRALPARNSRPALIAVHRDIGVLVSPALLILTLTGTMMALPDISKPLFGFSRAAPKLADPVTLGADWAKVLPAASSQIVGARLRQMAVASGADPAIVRFRQPGEWNRLGLSMVYVSHSGEIVRAVRAKADAPGARLYARIFPLHSAQVGSLLLRLVWLAGGLGLAVLSIMGAEAFRRQLGSRKQH